MILKNIKKIIAGTVAGAVMISAAACTPISRNAEWSYRDGKNEKAIGVYIFALYNAYNEAKTFAEKADGYKEDESFLDLKIKDDDGKEAVASDWIKEKADIAVRESLYLDNTMDKEKATIDEATLEEQADEDWELGYMHSYYSQYGYSTTPEKDLLEKYGVSKESYCDLRYFTSAKQSQLFDLLYGEGGSKEVSNDELKKYFDENYTYYSYFTVPLYEQVTDGDGNNTSQAYDKKKQTKLTNLANDYVKAINSGKSIEDQCKKYLKEIKSTAKVEDTIVSNCEILDKDNLSSSSLGEEVAKEFTDVKVGKAKAITIGKDDTKTIYVIQKNKTEDGEKEYLTKDDSTRKSVLQNMKQDEYNDYLEKEAKNLKCEVNSSVIDDYDPEMFWEEPEEETTTSAESNEAAE